MVVNNNAAAVLLVLAALAAGRDVPVSRGESVEIGGGFRVPEVMEQSSARLVDVGTTNRTRVADYRRAVDGGDVAMVLKVHPSNYAVTGFVETTSIAELATLGVPVVADLGSGLLDATCPWWPGAHPPPWLAGEPAARQTLAAGAALVTFSGDKLLGGPQAGIIAGRADLVARCAAHPLARALRPGSLVLAALQDLAMAYLDRQVLSRVPFWRLAAVPVAELSARAAVIAEAVGGDAVATDAVPGAGSAPGATIPSAGVRVAGDRLAALACPRSARDRSGSRRRDGARPASSRALRGRGDHRRPAGSGAEPIGEATNRYGGRHQLRSSAAIWARRFSKSRTSAPRTPFETLRAQIHRFHRASAFRGTRTCRRRSAPPQRPPVGGTRAVVVGGVGRQGGCRGTVGYRRVRRLGQQQRARTPVVDRQPELVRRSEPDPALELLAGDDGRVSSATRRARPRRPARGCRQPPTVTTRAPRRRGARCGAPRPSGGSGRSAAAGGTTATPRRCRRTRRTSPSTRCRAESLWSRARRSADRASRANKWPPMCSVWSSSEAIVPSMKISWISASRSS